MANVSSESGAPAHPTATLKKTDEKKQQHTLAGEWRVGLKSTNVLLRNGCSLLQRGKLRECE